MSQVIKDGDIMFPYLLFYTFKFPKIQGASQMSKYLPRHSFWALVAMVGVFVLAASPGASADYLYGKQLSVQVFEPTSNSPLGQPVIFTANGTNEVELSGNAPGGFIVNVNLIVSDTTIEFIYKQSGFFTPAMFNGYVFKAISPDIPAFTSLTVNPATTLAGFDSSRISFTSNQIDLNVQSLSSSVGTVLKLDLVVTPNAVPEPASIALLCLGVLPAMIFARRGSSGSPVPGGHSFGGHAALSRGAD